MITLIRLLTLCFISAVNMIACVNAFSTEIDRVQLVRALPQSGFNRDMISFNNKAFFLYESPRGLWQSDGTANGTKVIKSFPNGSTCEFIIQRWGNDYAPSQSSNPIVLNSHFYFYVQNYYGETELWKSNGTTSGTVRIKHVGNEWFSSYAMLNNIIYLLGDRSLWRTNGTTAGTWKVASLNNASSLVAFNDRLFFTASDLTHDRELWVSNGIATGTKLFVDIKTFDTTYPCGEGDCTDSSSWLRDLIVHRNILYFIADDGIHGRELWKTNGTKSGTHMVADCQPGSQGSYFENPVAIGNHLLFTGCDELHGCELWKTDGTSDGTFLLTDLKPGTGSSLALEFFAAKMNDELYFTTWNHLWKTDGTRNGTKLVKSGLSNSYTESSSAILDDRLYFCGGLTDDNDELWVTDGTSNGTELVKEIFPGRDTYGNFHPSIPRNFVTVGNFILFDAYYEVDSTSGYNIYKEGLFSLERSTISISPFLLPLLLDRKVAK